VTAAQGCAYASFTSVTGLATLFFTGIGADGKLRPSRSPWRSAQLLVPERLRLRLRLSGSAPAPAPAPARLRLRLRLPQTGGDLTRVGRARSARRRWRPRPEHAQTSQPRLSSEARHTQAVGRARRRSSTSSSLFRVRPCDRWRLDGRLCVGRGAAVVGAVDSVRCMSGRCALRAGRQRRAALRNRGRGSGARLTAELKAERRLVRSAARPRQPEPDGRGPVGTRNPAVSERPAGLLLLRPEYAAACGRCQPWGYGERRTRYGGRRV
jgi:hypothetical protein